MKINNKKIDYKNYPYIVAEISANHNNSLDNAKKLIQVAKIANADAVKLQTYKPDSLTINSNKDDFLIKHGLWKGKTLHELYKLGSTPWSWHKDLFNYAKDIGITIFSSPFDKEAVDLLEDLNAPAYKIASFEIVDLELIKYTAQTMKPIIVSTGMASEVEISNALDVIHKTNNTDIALLHCVSGYPASPSEYNLKTIDYLKRKYNTIVGLSDHTINNTTAITSVALGASIIEKHITLDRNGGGLDDSFSITPDELSELVASTRIAKESIGMETFKLQESEKKNILYRRSLYFVKEIKKGEVITSEHIRSIRPGYGLSPDKKSIIIGKKATNNFDFGDRVEQDSFE